MIKIEKYPEWEFTMIFEAASYIGLFDFWYVVARYSESDLFWGWFLPDGQVIVKFDENRNPDNRFREKAKALALTIDVQDMVELIQSKN